MTDSEEYMNKIADNRDDWDDSLFSPEDMAITECIARHLGPELDIEEVKSDPGYKETVNTVRLILADYTPNTGDENDRKYIIEALSSIEKDEKIRKEIRTIEKEINDEKINDISSDWVKEWHERKQGIDKNDALKQEMSEYISSSLAEKENNITDKKRVRSRNFIIRYISLAAAIIGGAVIIITSLNPTDNYLKIYNKYYEPTEASSPVTRGSKASVDELWANATADYNNGDYEDALIGFRELNNNDPSSLEARYYLGLTFMGLEDYSSAASLLSGVAGEQSKFSKESHWYLGLVCLKQENAEAARESFKMLAKSPGFYYKPSRKILRRLK